MNIRERFLDVYDRYADAIYRHCFFRVFSKPRAEELMQETFLRAWEYLGKGSEVRNMKAFLYRIATNLIIDESRKRKEVSLEALAESSHEFEPSSDGERDMERQVFIREIFEEFRRLGSGEQSLLVMRYVDDLDPKEIAEILGVSANNVSVRLNRALGKVKGKMQRK